MKQVVIYEAFKGQDKVVWPIDQCLSIPVRQVKHRERKRQTDRHT